QQLGVVRRKGRGLHRRDAEKAAEEVKKRGRGERREGVLLLFLPSCSPVFFRVFSCVSWLLSSSLRVFLCALCVSAVHPLFCLLFGPLRCQTGLSVEDQLLAEGAGRRLDGDDPREFIVEDSVEQTACLVLAGRAPLLEEEGNALKA